MGDRRVVGDATSGEVHVSGAAPENGSRTPDRAQAIEMLDDAVQTAREALDDIGRAKALYGQFLQEVQLRRDRLGTTEQELRDTADALVGEILGPAESALQEIMEIKKALERELTELQGRMATASRLQAELEKAKERSKRLQQEKEEGESRLASLQRQHTELNREIENIRARRAAEEGEMLALRADNASLREEIDQARDERDRFRDLLGNVRTALEDGGQIDRGNFPDVMENRG